MTRQDTDGRNVPAVSDANDTCSICIDAPPYEAPPPSYSAAVGELSSVNDPPPAYSTLHPDCHETETLTPLQQPAGPRNAPPVVRHTTRPKSKCSGGRITTYITIIIIKIIVIGSLANRKKNYVLPSESYVPSYSYESHPDYSLKFKTPKYNSEKELDFFNNYILSRKTNQEKENEFREILFGVNRDRRISEVLGTKKPEPWWKVD